MRFLPAVVARQDVPVLVQFVLKMIVQWHTPLVVFLLLLSNLFLKRDLISLSSTTIFSDN